MKSIKKLVAVALTGVLMFSVTGCSMIKKTDAAMQKTVVAKVGDEKITLGEVNKELTPVYKQLEQKYGKDYKNDEKAKAEIIKGRKEVLNMLISNKVVLIEAKKLNLVPSDEELNKETEELYNNFKKRIEAQGQTYDEYLKESPYNDEEIKQIFKEQVISNKVMEDITKNINITDEDVEKFYNENKETKFVSKPAGAKAKHLLFETEEQAKDAKSKIDAGTSFDELFKEYAPNKAANKKPIAEDLGFVAYNQQNFDPAFLQGLKPLKEGEISGPIKSSFGYHIIQAKDIKAESEYQPLNDDLKKQIKGILEYQKKQEIYQESLKKWKDELGVKIYDKNLEEGI